MAGSLRCFWQLAARQQQASCLPSRKGFQLHYRRTLVARCADKDTSQAAVVHTDVLEFKVSHDDTAKGKLRLDAYLTAQMPQSSRGKLQAAIKAGNVNVNGRPELKTSVAVRCGDAIQCVLLEAPVMQALPEDLPLDVVYEDDHVLVVNKAAGMVVHPAPGHPTGTLVNAFLHHCGLPAVPVEAQMVADDSSDACAESDIHTSDSDEEGAAPALAPAGSLRPGIVHRLDKGTTGLLVIAKDEYSLMHLSDQFRARSVQRTYQSITLGCPSPPQGQVSTNIGRDSSDRKKMAAFPTSSSRGRSAVSGFRVVRALGDGAAALVEWQLQTGRTHQIRVHAKHIGHSLFGDDAYGGAAGSAVSALGRSKSLRQAVVWKALKELSRPALHAQTLGFTHPLSGQRLQFTSELPPDLVRTLAQLDELK
ncbi:hypothetical protein ABBQ32_009625 [Trebouxia sp. C0010 RCD-2024]